MATNIMRVLGRLILLLAVAGAEAFSSPTAFGLVRGRALAFPSSQPAPLSLRLPKLDDGTLVKGVVMMAKKKKKQKDTMVGFSTDADSSGMSQEEEEPFMNFPSDSGMLKPSEIKGAGDPDAEIKKLKRDKKLEALFEEIPKEALAPAPKIKNKSAESKAKKGLMAGAFEQDDPEAAFGLSGDVVRLVKKGTWACMALLVVTLVIVRSPLIGFFRPDLGTVEAAKKEERAELDRQGKKLPGIRPFPSLQLTPEEVAGNGDVGTSVKIVEDVDKAKGEGVTINIGGGQKIKLVKKKAASPAPAPSAQDSSPSPAGAVAPAGGSAAPPAPQ